jgi:hypothetical protein
MRLDLKCKAAFAKILLVDVIHTNMEYVTYLRNSQFSACSRHLCSLKNKKERNTMTSSCPKKGKLTPSNLFPLLRSCQPPQIKEWNGRNQGREAMP